MKWSDCDATPVDRCSRLRSRKASATEKYDATAVAMIAQLKYGSGVPFTRLERLEQQLGIPLPAATQWEIVEEAAEADEASVRDGLIWQAARARSCITMTPECGCCGWQREPSDKRTGCSPRGIVSVWRERKIALYFTGRQHAGENLADVLKRRGA